MKKLLALVLALVMTMSLVTISNAAFKDADQIDADYKEAVDVMNAVGVLVGSNGSFDPKAELTRAQAAKIISYLDLGAKTADAFIGTGTYFSDVKANDWFAGYVEYCAQAGYVNGIGNGLFAPNEKVTGYQFAKMLLCVLGYNTKYEKLSGSDWQINTAKLAADNNLFEGIETKGSVAYTREQAAQMAFNSLLATMVDYSSEGVTVKGDGFEVITSTPNAYVVTSSNSKATAIDNNTPAGYSNPSLELGEKLYDGDLAKANETKYGHYNRYFTLNGKRISDDVAVDKTLYTTNTLTSTTDFSKLLNKGNKEYMGFESEKNATTPANWDVTVYVNGALTGTTYTSYTALQTAVTAYLRKGVIFEFVDTSSPTNSKYDVVNIIEKTVYTLTGDADTKAIDNNDAQVKVPGVAGMGGFTAANTVKTVFGYEGLKKDDVVLAYTSNGDTFIEKAAVVEGKVTGIKDGSKLVVAGTAYGNSGIKNATNTWSADYTNTYKFYLDNANAVVKAVKVTDINKDYAFVLEGNYVNVTGGSLADSKYGQARLLKTDGTVEIVRISKIDGTKIAASSGVLDTTARINAAIQNKFVTYKISDGKYELTTKTTGNVTGNITGNKANFANSYVANDNTVFLVNTKTANDPSITVYTGIKAAPSVTSPTAGYTFVDDGYAKYVYVQAASANISGAVSDYVYIPGTGANHNQMSYTYVPETSDGKGDDYYLFNAVINGVAGELKVAALTSNVDTDGNSTADGNLAINTLYKMVSTDSNHYVSLLSTHDVAPVTGVSVSGGTMKVDTQGANTSYIVTDKSIAYYIDKEGVVTELKARDIVNDKTDKVFVAKTSDNGKVAETVYVIEQTSATAQVLEITYAIGSDTTTIANTTDCASTPGTAGTVTVAGCGAANTVVSITGVTTLQGAWAADKAAVVGGADTVTLTITAEDGTTLGYLKVKFTT